MKSCDFSRVAGDKCIAAEEWYCCWWDYCWAVQVRRPQTDWSEITRLLRFSHLVHTWLRHPSLLLSLLLLLLLPLVRMEIALRLLDLVTGSQDLDQAFRNWATLTS